MCIRPYIVYVTTQAVFDGLHAYIEKTGFYGSCVGFDRDITAKIDAAEQAGDQGKADHWRNIWDLGTRCSCSPLSGIEVDGKIVYENELSGFTLEPDQIVRVYIGNPLNPQHEHMQPAITLESMKAINRAIGFNHFLSV